MNDEHTTHAENIEFEAFFERLKPLITFKGEVITSAEEDRFLCWMRDATRYLGNHKFVKTCLIRLVGTLKNNPDFFGKIIICSDRSLKYFSAHKFSILLNDMTYFTNFLPARWMDDWYTYSKECLVNFSCIDFYKSLNSFAILEDEKPSDRWMHEWFKQSCRGEWTATSHEFFQLIRLLQKMAIDIDPHWLNRWLTFASEQLNKVPAKPSSVNDILHIADFIMLPPIAHHASFMKTWFKKLHSIVQYTNDKQIKHVFHQVNKAEIDVPKSWLADFSGKMAERLNRLSESEIAHMLQVFAWHQYDEESIRPFLEKASQYLLRKENYFFNEVRNKNLQAFKEVLIAHKYSWPTH